MKKLLLLSGLVITLLLFSSAKSYACSCLVDDEKASLKKQVKRAVKDANAVFGGEVLSVEKDSLYSVKVTIKVNAVWKGNLSETVTISTGIGNGDCGYLFREGKNYLVYADRGANLNSLTVGYCSRTTVLSKDTEDLALLGKGKVVKSEFQKP